MVQDFRCGLSSAAIRGREGRSRVIEKLIWYDLPNYSFKGNSHRTDVCPLNSGVRRQAMNLRELLEQIDVFPETASVYVADRLDLNAAALVHDSGEDDPPSRIDSMVRAIDVGHAKDTLDGLRNLLRMQAGSDPSQDELFERFLVFLRNDA